MREKREREQEKCRAEMMTHFLLLHSRAMHACIQLPPGKRYLPSMRGTAAGTGLLVLLGG